MLHRSDFQDLLSASHPSQGTCNPKTQRPISAAVQQYLDVKLLKPVADLIALLVAYIIHLSLKTCVCPSLPKNRIESFSGKNSRPISLLPALSKRMEQIIYEHIQGYFL